MTMSDYFELINTLADVCVKENGSNKRKHRKLLIKLKNEVQDKFNLNDYDYYNKIGEYIRKEADYD